MDFEEYEPREGWKRFCEERSGKMDLVDVMLSVACAIALMAAYAIVGTLEVM